MKAATDTICSKTLAAAFQSTPPVKAATERKAKISFDRVISIHAAREGGDQYDLQFVLRANISIHAAREGGDNGKFASSPVNSVFQSTPPVKAATQPCSALARQSRISIHAAREGGDGIPRNPVAEEAISIHAAREGGDNHVQTIQT